MDVLIEEGLSQEQAIGAMMCLMVWNKIDFSGNGLWKNAGPKIYDLFSDRVKSSCSAESLAGYVCKLGRKCGVTNPRFVVSDFKYLRDLSVETAEKVFRELKHNTGIIIAGMRRKNEIEKERYANANIK